MQKTALTLFLFSLVSCKAIMVGMMLKDPKVENTKTIKSFQEKNNFSTENSLILKADTATAIEKLFLGMPAGYHIFNKEGDLICYNAPSTCHGTQFSQLMNNQLDSFKLCKNDSVSLQKVLDMAYDLNEKNVDKNQFAIADYYVVTYWQKFLGGKRGYEDAVTWMEDEIKNNKSGLKFTFIKINTDLQENWGLMAGKKAKLKWKLKGDMMDMEVINLPVKK